MLRSAQHNGLQPPTKQAGQNLSQKQPPQDSGLTVLPIPSHPKLVAPWSPPCSCPVLRNPVGTLLPRATAEAPRAVKTRGGRKQKGASWGWEVVGRSQGPLPRHPPFPVPGRGAWVPSVSSQDCARSAGAFQGWGSSPLAGPGLRPEIPDRPAPPPPRESRIAGLSAPRSADSASTRPAPSLRWRPLTR